MKTSKDRILNHLKNGGEISVMTALNDFQCGGLSSLISRLRKQGYPIVARRESNVTNKGYHFVYYLAK